MTAIQSISRSISLIICVSISTTILAQIPPNVPQNGLVAYYPFKGNANDLGGSNNNGTIISPTLTADKYGNANSAYSFNGTSDYIQLPNAFFNTGGQQSAFSFRTVLKRNQNNIITSIWGKTYFWKEINFEITNTNNIKIYWANSLTGNRYSTVITNLSPIQKDTWYDIVVTFDNGTCNIYLNGVKQSVLYEWRPQYGSILSTTEIERQVDFSTDAGSSKIGIATHSASLTNYFSGTIDEFGIWSRALTQQEITELYASTTTTPSNVGININSPQRNLHVKDVIRLEPRYQAPDNPGEGDIYYDGILHRLRLFDGTTWQNL